MKNLGCGDLGFAECFVVVLRSFQTIPDPILGRMRAFCFFVLVRLGPNKACRVIASWVSCYLGYCWLVLLVVGRE